MESLLGSNPQTMIEKLRGVYNQVVMNTLEPRCVVRTFLSNLVDEIENFNCLQEAAIYL